MHLSTELRTLLRHLHRPLQLEKNALGRALKEALQERTVREALARTIAECFADCGEQAPQYRRILERFDLSSKLTRAQAAAELGISERRFYYVHAQAVTMLAQYIDRVLTQRSGDPLAQLYDELLDYDPQRAGTLLADPVKRIHAAVISSPIEGTLGIPPALHGSDAAVVHALMALWQELRGHRAQALTLLQRADDGRLDERGERIPRVELAVTNTRMAIARHDASARGAARVAQRARTLLTWQPSHITRWVELFVADAALAAGDEESACEVLDGASRSADAPSHRFTAMLVLRRAQLALSAGDFERAIALSAGVANTSAAHLDLVHLADIVHARATMLAGRSALQLRTANYGLWHLLYSRAIEARRLISTDPARAEDLAERTAATATVHAYAAVAAHARATLARCTDDAAGAAAAWELWLQGRDMEQGLDIFASGERFTPPLLHAIHGLALREHRDWPVLRFINSPSDSELFWSNAIRAALIGSEPAKLAPLLARLPAPSPAELHARPLAPTSPRMFAALVAMLAALPDRRRFRDSLADLLTYCNARCRRRVEHARARAALELSG
jgi:hypothetical protein